MNRRASGRIAFFGMLLVCAASPVLAVDCSVSSGLTLPLGMSSFNLGGTFASSFLQGVADRWNEPCGNSSGSRFPELRVGFGDLSVTLNFFNNARNDASTKNGCEETAVHLDANGVLSSATITVWAQKRDGTGCGASTEDLAVHGFGHVLGLADTPDPACDGTIMGRPVPGTPMVVGQDHCEQADENWTTELELDPCFDPNASMCECDPYWNCSPIILDIDRNGFRLSGLDDPVRFDINADGVAETIAWTSADEGDGLLALDRNGDGLISDGGELFGDSTLLADGSLAPHGFAALAEFDLPEAGGNGNGVIDAGDAVFHQLRVWFDRDHDGVSSPGELFALDELGIVRLDLEFVESSGRRDRHGNRLRYNGKAWMVLPSGKGEVPIACSDVFFQMARD